MGDRSRILYVAAGLVAFGICGAACSGAAKRAAGPGGGVHVAAGQPNSRNADSATLADVQVPQAAPKIVKTADLSLQVARGRFAQQFQAATLVAARHGGFVSTTMQTSDAKLPSGTLVLRVPADQFEASLAELRTLGKVQSEGISGQDVTSQFVDLDARLRNSRAQEAVLLRLMSRSASIEDSLKVQSQLQSTQLQIEQLQGQLRLLSDQAALSSISLTLNEAAPPVPAEPRSTFVRAWKQSAHGLRVFAAGLVVAFGYLAPFVLIGLVGLAGWSAVRRLRPLRSGA
jgi:hypothetical protein